MIYMGSDDSGIHRTQIQCAAAMLSRGVPIDNVVSVLMAATRVAAGDYGARWNWRLEERNIRKDCKSWLKKHPEIKERQQQYERAKERDEAEPAADTDAARVSAGGQQSASWSSASSLSSSSSSSSTASSPSMGHNSKGKLPFHVMLSNAYLEGMKQGIGQRFRRIPDLKGNDHIWRYRDGLWSLQSDRDAARALHPLLQQIINDLGLEKKSSNKLFNEATAHMVMTTVAVSLAALRASAGSFWYAGGGRVAAHAGAEVRPTIHRAWSLAYWPTTRVSIASRHSRSSISDFGL
jgi:hypothetical protein